MTDHTPDPDLQRTVEELAPTEDAATPGEILKRVLRTGDTSELTVDVLQEFFNEVFGMPMNWPHEQPEAKPTRLPKNYHFKVLEDE
jgi:hypothetical protein